MGTSDYSDEFKRDAMHQITVRGYAQQPKESAMSLETPNMRLCPTYVVW